MTKQWIALIAVLTLSSCSESGGDTKHTTRLLSWEDLESSSDEAGAADVQTFMRLWGTSMVSEPVFSANWLRWWLPSELDDELLTRGGCQAALGDLPLRKTSEGIYVDANIDLLACAGLDWSEQKGYRFANFRGRLTLECKPNFLANWDAESTYQALASWRNDFPCRPAPQARYKRQQILEIERRELDLDLGYVHTTRRWQIAQMREDESPCEVSMRQGHLSQHECKVGVKQTEISLIDAKSDPSVTTRALHVDLGDLAAHRDLKYFSEGSSPFSLDQWSGNIEFTAPEDFDLADEDNAPRFRASFEDSKATGLL